MNDDELIERLNRFITCGCCDDDWPLLRRDIASRLTELKEALLHVRRIAEPLIQLDDVWEDATHIISRIDRALSTQGKQGDENS